MFLWILYICHLNIVNEIRWHKTMRMDLSRCHLTIPLKVRKIHDNPIESAENSWDRLERIQVEQQKLCTCNPIDLTKTEIIPSRSCWIDFINNLQLWTGKTSQTPYDLLSYSPSARSDGGWALNFRSLLQLFSVAFRN